MGDRVADFGIDGDGSAVFEVSAAGTEALLLYLERSFRFDTLTVTFVFNQQHTPATYHLLRI